LAISLEGGWRGEMGLGRWRSALCGNGMPPSPRLSEVFWEAELASALFAFGRFVGGCLVAEMAMPGA
jgi:hypothetical protein